MSTNSSIYKKLLKFQMEVEAIKKDSTNPHFKSKYFDINTLLEEVIPKLTAAGLVLTQCLDTQDDEKGCKTYLVSKVIDSDTGEAIVSKAKLPDVLKPHELGSAITYYRRYSLQSMLGLMAEDDDGNTASGSKPVGSGGGFKPKTFGGK